MIHSPQVVAACLKIKTWHDNNQPCPIYKPYEKPGINYLIEHQLIKFTGMSRCGPLGVYTGEHCFRLTESGLDLCKSKTEHFINQGI